MFQLIVVDWFEYSNSLLFNSLAVMKLQGTSGKETPKLSCQVLRVTAGIKTLSGPKRKNASWASLLYILRLIQGFLLANYRICYPQ